MIDRDTKNINFLKNKQKIVLTDSYFLGQYFYELVYDTTRIKSGFKTGYCFILLNFILSISSILTMHKCFP